MKCNRIYASLIFCATILLLSTLPTSAIATANGNPTLEPYVVVDQSVTDHIWSPDGTKIAYVKCPEGQYWGGELWVADWNGRVTSNNQLIFTGVEWDRLDDWKGDWILFSRRDEQHPPAQYYGARELWKIRYDGTGLTQVTFTWSNGIYWSGYRDGWVYGFPLEPYINVGTVSWGRFIPGTNLVYFSAHDGNGWYQPYTCNDDGSDQFKHISAYPYFYSFMIGLSPTGNKLLWGHAWYWNEPTYLMTSNVDGSDRLFIKYTGYRFAPLVLADGNTIIWQYQGNIYAMDMDGSNERTVIDDNYMNYWESYDPLDGQSLLMRSNRDPDGNWHIFTINVDGTGIEQLTEGPYDDYAPIYSPDGHSIMYRRLPDDFVPTTDQPYPYELVIKRIPVQITIDIKPGSNTNPINLKSNGKTPVAILTTDTFDASTANPGTLQFAGASPLKWSLEDVDNDGDLDLVLHFKTQELALTKDSTAATLIGETFDGVLIKGTDSVRIVPP